MPVPTRPSPTPQDPPAPTAGPAAVLGSDPAAAPTTIEVIGAGRVGRALAAALRGAGFAVTGPSGRGADGTGAEIVLLAVPDAAIAEAAAAVAPGRLVGHLSGATGLDALAPHRGFGLHPLTTVTGTAAAGSAAGDEAGAGDAVADAGAVFRGTHVAVAGTDPAALRTAEDLARALGARPFAIAEADRAAYHAAASIAANFLVTLEDFAEGLASTAGVDRAALVPLVRAAVDHWADLGAEAALTGPIARGDRDTVDRQRRAVAARTPDRLALFDALAAATAALAARRDGGGDA